MPVSGNPYGTLKRALQKTARDRQRAARAAAGAVKELLREQFAGGINPLGAAQAATKGGSAGLVSTKLANVIKVTAEPGRVEGVGELRDSPKGKAAKRQWLEAHQKGHTFPARRARGNRIAFNAAGKRVSIAKLKRGAKGTLRVTTGQREAYWRTFKNSAKLRGRITNAREHVVGARVLPVRQIYPEVQLGPRWARRIKTAVAEALKQQLEQDVEKGG